MDFLEAADAALEKRARAFEVRKAVEEDGAIADGEKAVKLEAIDKDIDTLGTEARSHFQAHKKDAELRELRAEAASLSGGREQRDNGAGRGAESDQLRKIGRGELREANFDIPDGLNFRTATTGVAANAGNTKPTATFVNTVLEAMRVRSSFFSYVDNMVTSSGETLEIPTFNSLGTGTPVTGTVGTVAENTVIPKVDTAWSKVNLYAYKYGVMAEVTAELLEDSSIDILGRVANKAGEALSDKIMADLLLGSGTAQPFGWVTRATAAANIASLSAITFDTVIDLQYSLSAAYRPYGIYMFNDAAIPVLRKLKDSTGNYLWTPSVQAGQPDTIWGKPVLTDPNIAVSGASAKVGIYGDPSKYTLRTVRNFKVTRSDEYGFDRDVVAFKITWRGDGNLFDQSSVKALTVTA